MHIMHDYKLFLIDDYEYARDRIIFSYNLIFILKHAIFTPSPYPKNKENFEELTNCKLYSIVG